jgi:signal transduction histidine kinase
VSALKFGCGTTLAHRMEAFLQVNSKGSGEGAVFESRSTVRKRIELDAETDGGERLVEAIAVLADARAVVAWGPDGTFVASSGWEIDPDALAVARDTLAGRDVAEPLERGDAALAGLDRGCPGSDRYFAVAPSRDPVGLLLAVDSGRRFDDRLDAVALLGPSALRCSLGGSLESARLATTREIVSGVGHDVGTPLNVISGYSEYLLMGLGEDARGRKELSSILEQTRRVAQMIQQMLDVVRTPPGESGHSRPLTVFCDEALHLATYMLRKAQVKFVIEGTASEQVRVSGDLSLLHQAVFNVLSEAAKRAGVGAQLILRPTVGPTGHGIEIEGRDASGASVDFTPIAEARRDGIWPAFVGRVLDAHAGGLELLGGNGDGAPRLFVRLGA